MTDEHRGDALGIEGHPIVETPYLDALATSGTHFTAGYSATPSHGDTFAKYHAKEILEGEGVSSVAARLLAVL